MVFVSRYKEKHKEGKSLLMKKKKEMRQILIMKGREKLNPHLPTSRVENLRMIFSQSRSRF